MSSFLPLVIISGLVICFITLVNTNFALIVLIFSMLLSPELGVGMAAGRPIVLRLEDVLLIIVFITWIAKLAINKELGLLKYTPLNLPIGIYIGILAISTLLAAMLGRVNFLRGSFYILKYIEYYMLFFMVTNSIKSKRQIKVFVFFIFLTALITSVYALSTVGAYGRATAPFEDVIGEGSGGEPNTLGGYLLLIFALIAGFFLYNKNTLVNLGLGMLAILVVITLLNTLSRGSYLGFMGAFLALTILAKRKKFLLISLILLFIFMGQAILPDRVNQRISETFTGGRVYEPWSGARITLDESTSFRIESWRSVFTEWKKSPILGYGVTGIGFIDAQYALILGETGFLGLMAFAWLMLTIFKNSLWVFKNIEDDYFRGLSLGYIVGLVGLLFHSFSAATFIIVRIMEPFWFLTAIIMVLAEGGISELPA